MRTRDNDPVISLHLSDSYLTLGDVNGELHRLEVSQLLQLLSEINNKCPKGVELEVSRIRRSHHQPG